MSKTVQQMAYVILLVGFASLTMGCAAAYHCYPCGRVSCGYCPPPPLPYRIGHSCCLDSPGQKYLGTNAPTVSFSSAEPAIAEPYPYFNEKQTEVVHPTILPTDKE